MAEIIESTSSDKNPGWQAPQTVNVTFKNVLLVNNTIGNSMFSIKGEGGMPPGSSVPIDSLVFNTIVLTYYEDGQEKTASFYSTQLDGSKYSFEDENCTFSGPEYGTVSLKGSKSGNEVAFTPQMSQGK